MFNLNKEKNINMKNITQDQAINEITKLEHIIMNTNINSIDVYEYTRYIIHLEKYFFEDTDKNKKYISRLDRLYKYLQQLQVEHNHFKNNILTIITTIFLPLGVIVGYFGMNFKSMGVPSLKTGIFNTDKAQHYVFWLGLIAAMVILFLFYILQYGLK